MVEVRNISQVNLRVRNLRESVAFYREVLGLQPCDSSSESLRERRLEFGGSGGDTSSAILLSEGRPIPGASGLNHFTLEADGAETLDRIYHRAISRAARVTLPRTSGNSRQLFVFDPDGHKIEIVAIAEDCPTVRESYSNGCVEGHNPGE